MSDPWSAERATVGGIRYLYPSAFIGTSQATTQTIFGGGLSGQVYVSPDQKADALLRKHVTDAQWQQYRTERRIIETIDGVRYAVNEHGPYTIDGNGFAWCLTPRGRDGENIPTSDKILTLLFLLRHVPAFRDRLRQGYGRAPEGYWR